MMDKPKVDPELEDKSCYLCKHFAICSSTPSLFFRIQCLENDHDKWEEELHEEQKVENPLLKNQQYDRIEKEMFNMPILPEETIIEKPQIIAVPEKIKNRAKIHIQTYSDQFMRVPSQAWLSKKLHLSLGKTTLIMKALLQDKFFFKKGNIYVRTNTQGDNIRIPTGFDRLKAKVKLSPAVVFMKIILFIIGCGATYMSIFHSTDFLSEYYNSFKAILAAIIMICFNVLSAEMIIFFHLKSLRVPTVVFSIILILGTVFSMGSTIVGLYNSRAVEITEKYTIENTEDRILKSTQLDYNVLLSKKSQAEQNLNSERDKRNGLVKILNTYTPEMIENNQDYYNKQNGRRYVADVRVDKAQKIFNKIILEEQEFLKFNVVVESTKRHIPENAYSWIANAVFPDMKPESLQFWMSVYPALFYDIIAPISFSVVFFVGVNIPTKRIKQVTRKRKRK